MKPKSHCPNCGRFGATKKLTWSNIQQRNICPFCKLKENYNQFKAHTEPIINGVEYLPKFNKNTLKMAKNQNRSDTLTRDEILFLKSKYKKDCEFITGKKEIGEIERLKEGLVKVKRPTPKAKPSSNLKNKRFLEGLK